ncbi:hypothetical protein [Wolbachia endosymbiont of Ctenocephalides felis wCfeT]|uniref:hypothetical protein n=1 Tax=Wolbachia endosymbiont of Ctenocephalides felis wCfeT TaxID=2732593 RepID=UPI001444F9AF|nr:hypothetical protein [Wolbachia endosymbiont of Ctenocephalides felis wCfeT]
MLLHDNSVKVVILEFMEALVSGSCFLAIQMTLFLDNLPKNTYQNHAKLLAFN